MFNGAFQASLTTFYWNVQEPTGLLLTCIHDRLQGQLIASLLDTGIESWDVSFLSERIGARKNCFHLSQVTLLKTPAEQRNRISP